MKSWRYYGTGEPLQLDEVPEPRPGPGEVVIKVAAVGICHSDVSAQYEPSWGARLSVVPQTFGHENAGTIISVGEGVTGWANGDRVGMVPVLSSGESLGYEKWAGGFGPQMRVPVEALVRLPDEVPFDLGAMGTDAGLTAYHGMVTRGGAAAGRRVGVIGIGGLGYMGARIAVLLGAEVYAAEINPDARALADEIGLSGVAESITAFADKDLELIVDYAGFGTTTAEAIKTLGDKGVLVQVGLGRLEATIDTYAVMDKELSVRGSKSGTKEDLGALYELLRGGQFAPPITHVTPAEIPAAVDRLRDGGVVGRIVAMYED